MKSLKYLTLFLVMILALGACLRKDYELPADSSQYDPNLTTTTDIAGLLAMNAPYDFTTGGPATEITDDVVVAAVVSADDRTGNFYKRIVVQDSSAGVTVLIDAYSLYTTLPVGRKIYLKCKGLYLGYDGGLPVIGFKPNTQMEIEAIPASEINNHIVKANVGHEITPIALTMAQAKSGNPAYYNRLVTITEAQFVDSNLSYTQPNGTTNRDLMDCSNIKVPVRTSNFATFAPAAFPYGKGSITGIYTIFISSTSGNKTAQLVLRDTSDVHLNGPRCGAGPVVPPAKISIDSLKKMYNGSTATLGNYSISGVVISDRSTKNINSFNMIIQDGDKGILVRFSATHQFDLGDSVEVDLSGGQIGEYNQLLEVGAVSGGSTFLITKATKLGTGQVTPKVLTIAQLIGGNFEDYESTLVTINAATIVGGGAYVVGTNGNKNLTDATESTGILKLYTTSSATFKDSTAPATPVSITGTIGQFNTTKQISIRGLGDVQ